MELNCQRLAFSSASLILGGNICNYFWYNKVINLRLRTALTTDAATARDLIKPAQMGRSRVLNPKNLAEIFNRQLFAAIKMRGDILSLSLSLRNKWKWTGKIDDFKATERKMKWLVLDGSQMSKCIYEFASQRDEAAATFSWSFSALLHQFNNSHGPNVYLQTSSLLCAHAD